MFIPSAIGGPDLILLLIFTVVYILALLNSSKLLEFPLFFRNSIDISLFTLVASRKNCFSVTWALV